MPALERKLRTSVSLSRLSSIARVRITISSTRPSAEPASPQNVRVVLNLSSSASTRLITCPPPSRS